jgi:hypothetical protein
MANEILELCAYHESGRVVFAYHAGFFCDGIELSASDYGRGKSVLNAGGLTPLIQQILSGNHLSVAAEDRNKAIETAHHLMDIYCAGSCTRAYYEQMSNPGEEMELDVPVQDDKPISAIQKFLMGINPGSDPNFPSKRMSAILQKLKEPETWHAIEALAKAAVAKGGLALTRFEIEDALMAGGLKVKRAASPGFNVGLGDASLKANREVMQDEPRPATGPLSTTDILLGDFFRTIRTDWSEAEAQAAVKNVKVVVSKYGLA